MKVKTKWLPRDTDRWSCYTGNSLCIVIAVPEVPTFFLDRAILALPRFGLIPPPPPYMYSLKVSSEVDVLHVRAFTSCATVPSDSKFQSEYAVTRYNTREFFEAPGTSGIIKFIRLVFITAAIPHNALWMFLFLFRLTLSGNTVLRSRIFSIFLIILFGIIPVRMLHFADNWNHPSTILATLFRSARMHSWSFV